MKKLKLAIPARTRPIDPLDVFKKLTLRGTIENIWEPQAEALKKWHKHRNKADVVVQMNTGGGKTLVGLVIAQSLVNETKGHVLYVCPNNQLIEQTCMRAKEMGISPTMRYKGSWTNRDSYDSGETFCLTNYATLFNGKSVFGAETLAAIIYDDAHTAGSIIRGQFTLRIPADHCGFKDLLGLLRKHFSNSSGASHFRDISDGRFTTVLFVPSFVTWQSADEIRKILLNAGVDRDESTLFAWEHVKEHLNHCCVLADGSGIEITPTVVPLSHLRYLNDGVRRTYLTATLPSRASFARTFGVTEPTIIQPDGKSGDAQRLMVFVPGEDDEAHRLAATEMVSDVKSCVISPSRRMGQEWVPPAVTYEAEQGQEAIDRFSQSEDPTMLGLVARYDGIDLPGEACRVLILDRLPSGESLIDRFIDESIRVETIRVAHTATRIVQAIGRIFRSNTDHGVVLLTGTELQAWLRKPANRAYLPTLLQQQLLLGCELAKRVENDDVRWADLMEGVLTGHDNWDDMYNKYIDQFSSETLKPETEWLVELIILERQAYEDLWKGQPKKAAAIYADLAEKAQSQDPRIAAWYRHWAGLAAMCADERDNAFVDFIIAANERAELGRPSVKRDAVFAHAGTRDIGSQAQTLAGRFRSKKRNIATELKQVETDLCYGPETTKAEEALKALGNLLGLEASRPDKQNQTGPDVLWSGNGTPNAWGFELKSNKKDGKEYTKAEIGQCHDHAQWLRDKYGANAELSIVGPIKPVSRRTNPASGLTVITIEEFRSLLDRVNSMYNAVDAGDKTNIADTFQKWINFYGLNWPSCVDALSSRLAEDLRDSG